MLVEDYGAHGREEPDRMLEKKGRWSDIEKITTILRTQANNSYLGKMYDCERAGIFKNRSSELSALPSTFPLSYSVLLLFGVTLVDVRVAAIMLQRIGPLPHKLAFSSVSQPGLRS